MPGLDDYDLTRVLARGGMGVVHEAVERATGRRVAIKRLLPGGDPGLVSRFLVESRALARLDHPGVVRVHTFGEAPGGPFLVMDLVEGESLQRVLDRKGPLAPERALALVDELADALAHAHQQGVLHRDLKPSNVLVDAAGRARLIDFGVARLQTDGGSLAHLTRTGELLGTPAFMAPEQADGRAVDERTDVYGLGALLFALLTGQPPFRAASPIALLNAVLTTEAPAPSSLRAGLSPVADALVLGCLAKDPARRPASMRELRRLMLEGPPTPARGRGRLVLGVAISLAATGSGAWALLGRPTPAPATPAAAPRERVERPEAATTPTDPELELARREVRALLAGVQGEASPVLRDRADAEEILARCDRVLAADRDDGPAHLVRGLARIRLDDVDAGLEDLDRAVRLLPSDPLARALRAVGKLEQGDFEGASFDLKKALDLDPGHAPALAVRVQLRMAQGAMGQALDDAERLVPLTGGAAFAHLLRAQVRLASKDTAGARADLDRAVALRPTSLAHMLRAQTRGADDAAAAIEDLLQAADLTDVTNSAAMLLDQAERLGPSPEQARRLAELRARHGVR